MNGFETILTFLKPIEHLILDDSISEVMVNGPGRAYVERAGRLEPHVAHSRAGAVLAGLAEFVPQPAEVVRFKAPAAA